MCFETTPDDIPEKFEIVITSPYKKFNVSFSQKRSVLNPSTASGELGPNVGEVALTQIAVAAVVDLGLVGSLVEVQIVGAVVVVHMPAALEDPAEWEGLVA